MEEVRKSRLFKNLSRRDQMELSKLSAQLKNMQEEMASLKELLEQLEELRATHHAKATATGIDATQLQTDRWYLTRIEEEAEMVQGRYDFMVAELAPLKAKILAVSYHKKRKEEKAEEFAVSAREKKFDKDWIYINKWIPNFEINNYLNYIVDHDLARKRALACYKLGLA